VVGDQALSSLTNFVLGVLVARSVSAFDFGAFSIAFTSYFMMLGVSRALATEPFVVRFPGLPDEEWRRGVRAASGSALAVGIALGVVTVAIGLLISGSLGTALLILGVLLPGLLLQDCWRFVFFAHRRGASAFFNDLLWAVVLLPSVAILSAVGQASVASLMLAWGAAAAAGAVFGIAQSRAMPQPLQIIPWLREQRDLAPRFFGEFAVRTAGGQLGTYGIGAVVGLAAVGALRAGDMLLGPINILSLAIGMAGVPEAVRLARTNLVRFRSAAVLLSAAMVAVVVVWGGISLLLPASVGTQILGPSWAGARTLLLPLVIAQAGAAALAGPATGLRALAAAQRTLRLRVVLSVVTLVVTIASAAIGGVVAAAWTIAVMACMGATLWWIEFHRELGARTGSAAAAAAGPGPNARLHDEDAVALSAAHPAE
jgi:O-antigen/teichoic acid export membrane protein